LLISFRRDETTFSSEFSHYAALVSNLGNLSKFGQIHIVRELPVGLHLPGVDVQYLQPSVFLYRDKSFANVQDLEPSVFLYRDKSFANVQDLQPSVFLYRDKSVD
jgi:hypothetical protein